MSYLPSVYSVVSAFTAHVMSHMTDNLKMKIMRLIQIVNIISKLGSERD